MTFAGLEKIMEFHDFSRFSMTGYTLYIKVKVDHSHTRFHLIYWHL